MSMGSIEYLKLFYEEVHNDKSTIFNYSKVSEFERNLFISISKFLDEKYNYSLKGLTKLHYIRLNNAIRIKEEDIKLIREAFELNSMITKRNVTMGYGGGYSEKKIIKNYKLESFLVDLKDYIDELDIKSKA